MAPASLARPFGQPPAKRRPGRGGGGICYKLKTGCQWRWLPVEALFTSEPLSWQGVYYHLNAWGQQGAWKNLWRTSLRLHRRTLDLSSIQLDGSHTLAKNGGAAIGYQGRRRGAPGRQPTRHV